jgi:2-polyprenyl-3-methyl-5-hydroxy-6-metoxy-1,4-benzoquinol methylase
LAATVTQTVSQIDAAKAQAFGAKMIDVVNKGSLALMTSIGHQTGLFETMKNMPPADSARIASASGLNERYVREWLGAMVTGEIVEYDAADRTYWLPPEHAASLTPEAGPRNVALVAQMIPLLASVEQNVVDSFRNGGGVHYHCYPRFHSLMAESSAAQFDSTLVSHVLPLIPGMVDRLREGAAVADIGCGAGHAVNVMARAFPKSSFTGYDFSEEAIETARKQAFRWGLKNAQFHVKDVSELNVRSGYDLITAFDAIHDQARPARVLEGIAAALKPEGKFLMVDIHASPRRRQRRPSVVPISIHGFLHALYDRVARSRRRRAGRGLGRANRPPDVARGRIPSR